MTIPPPHPDPRAHPFSLSPHSPNPLSPSSAAARTSSPRLAVVPPTPISPSGPATDLPPPRRRTPPLPRAAIFGRAGARGAGHDGGAAVAGLAGGRGMRRRARGTSPPREDLRGDVVEIETWCQADGRIDTRHDWIHKDLANGKVIGRATSKWVMMNQNTRRLQRVSDEVKDEVFVHCPKTPRRPEPESIDPMVPHYTKSYMEGKLGLGLLL